MNKIILMLFVIIVCNAGCKQSINTHKTDSLEDSSEDSKSTYDDLFEKDRSAQYIPEWEQWSFYKKCSPVHSKPKKPYNNAFENVESVVANVSWESSYSCAGEESGNVDNGSAYESMWKDGEKELVSTILHKYSEHGSVVADSFYTVDAKDGAVKSCQKINDRASVHERISVINPWTGKPIHFLASANQGDGPALVWWSDGWDKRHSIPLVLTRQWDQPIEVLFSEMGQLFVLFHSGGSLISLDAKTGEINWTLQPRDLDILTNNRNTTYTSNKTRIEGNNLLLDLQVGFDSLTAVFDICGKGTLSPEINEGKRVSLGNNSVLIKQDYESYLYDITLLNETGSKLSEALQCSEVVSVRENKIACIHATSRKRFMGRPIGLSITVLEENAEKVEFDILDDEFDSENVTFAGATTAMKSNILLLSSLVNNGGSIISKLYFYSLKKNSVLKTVKFPHDSFTGSTVQPPLVSEDGTVVVRYGGSLFGISTNVKGLAPGSFPRGIRYGRNDNIGIMQYE